MDHNMLSMLPRGKEDKPMLLNQGGTQIHWNINDTDGMLYMLDRDYGGCAFMPFSKEMNPKIRGKAILDGAEWLCVKTSGGCRRNVDAGGTPVRQTDYLWREKDAAGGGIYRYRRECDGSGRISGNC